VVDGSLGAGALPFDFGASGVDLYAADAHAFLLGPRGAGVGLFSPALLERLPSDELAVKGSEDRRRPPPEGSELRSGALRFEARQPLSLCSLMSLAGSLRLLLEATPVAVQAHCRALLERILERLPPGFATASPLDPERRSQVLCLAASSPLATAAARSRLQAAKVVVSLQGDRLRISPHLHAAQGDVDRLVSVLAAGA
jgi:selenocysteine lyase/cysteine desulfurase